MKTKSKAIWCLPIAMAAALIMSGCASSMREPATTSVAVSQSAVDNAAGAGGTELAPAEMAAAREKMAAAQRAMAAKDYTLANDLAIQAQADAKLAQGKANSVKARAVADALQADINVLREELARNGK